MNKAKHFSNKKIIIFDLGGVVLNFNHFLICEKLSEISHIPVHKIYKFIFNNGLDKKYDKGKITSNDFYKSIIDFLKINFSFNKFRNIWSNIFEENFETINILKELKEKKYKILLLSNTNELHFNFVKRKFDIVNIFDDYILSYKVGSIKPSVNIFKEALIKTNVDPINLIYIDDIKEYVIVAESLGMIGITFKNASQLIKDLSNYNI